LTSVRIKMASFRVFDICTLIPKRQINLESVCNFHFANIYHTYLINALHIQYSQLSYEQAFMLGTSKFWVQSLEGYSREHN
jgi:hypothetical protein